MSNHYLNLMFQVDKLHRHNRQGSYKTRARYYEAMQRFCRFLAEVYRLERLTNIAPKHIYAYVAYLQAQEKSASTIKTDLSAIRFFHDLIPNARYELPGNGDLSLQRRTFGGVDRTWSDAEFSRMLSCAAKAGRDWSIAPELYFVDPKNSSLCVMAEKISPEHSAAEITEIIALLEQFHDKMQERKAELKEKLSEKLDADFRHWQMPAHVFIFDEFASCQCAGCHIPSNPTAMPRRGLLGAA